MDKSEKDINENAQKELAESSTKEDFSEEEKEKIQKNCEKDTDEKEQSYEGLLRESQEDDSSREKETPQEGKEKPFTERSFCETPLPSEYSEENGEAQKINGRAGRIVLTALTSALLVTVCATSVWCIVTDVINSSAGTAGGGTNFHLDIYDRPDNTTTLTDENGKFTVEGLTKYMQPRIVRIQTYQKSGDESPTSGGSGIIISEDGYIVTNTHVLDNMAKYEVVTSDGKVYNAAIRGRDAKTDIAVIKIEASGLSPAKLGNSDEIIQGEAVVAIGSPAGLTGSVTNGIVSGVNRMIQSSATGFQMNCIQTDAAISPGNSGGALVNMYGQVIGITSSKYASTTMEGLGFAITVNDAKPVIEELISQGYVSGRVRIGITFYTTYAGYSEVKFKEDFGFDIPEKLKDALWIEKISGDCDIAKTKLEPGDFIISVDGKKVTDYNALSQAIRDKKGGDKVKAGCARVDKKGNIEYFDIEFKLMEDKSGNF